MVKTIYIEGKYDREIELSGELLEYIKRYKTIGLFSAIQFCNKLEKVKEQLQKFNVVTSQPKRCGEVSQLLGCDCFSDSLNLDEDVDAFLYIGDGKFHPLALVYGSEKEVICYNPKSNKFTVLSRKDVGPVLKKYKGALVKFHSSSNVGVMITLKPGQEFYKRSLDLEKKYPDKKFYYFIDNNINFDQLENFPFIDVWVNTACPRMGLDDQDMFRKGVVNLKDVL